MFFRLSEKIGGLGLIAQLTRAPDLHSGGRGFESHWVHNVEEKVRNKGIVPNKL